MLLRHHDLKTTQVSLGKINDSEAIRWMYFMGIRVNSLLQIKDVVYYFALLSNYVI